MAKSGEASAFPNVRRLPVCWFSELCTTAFAHQRVELIERALRNSSKRGDTVIDFFSGAGSKLIAAERCGRQARLIEIDPKYADVIIRRWQAYTGKQACLADDGRTYDEIRQERGRIAE